MSLSDVLWRADPGRSKGSGHFLEGHPRELRAQRSSCQRPFHGGLGYRDEAGGLRRPFHSHSLAWVHSPAQIQGEQAQGSGKMRDEQTTLGQMQYKGFSVSSVLLQLSFN